jgi:hypothetical protein
MQLRGFNDGEVGLLSQRISRRGFFTGASASLVFTAAGLEAGAVSAHDGFSKSGAIAQIEADHQSYRPEGEPFPGELGNAVGFAAAPGFPGHLTPWAGGAFQDGTIENPRLYSFFDFDAGKNGTLINASHVKFVGCRFQSNSLPNFNVQCTTATDVSFLYCSFTPRLDLYTKPPGAAWPSAGAGLQTTTQVSGINCIDGDSGYQYGLNVYGIGPLLADHCDFWGFGNGGPLFHATRAQITIRDCWIHDACNESPQGYHIDGTGYVDGTIPPSHVTIDHCTIASIGNTNALAFQTSTSPYDHISVTRNFFSGFGICVDICHSVAGSTNLLFKDNTFGTDIPWKYFPVYGDPTVLFNRQLNPTNLWHNNRLRVLPGTSPIAGSGFRWTSSQNGFFMWPSNTLHTTDYPG